MYRSFMKLGVLLTLLALPMSGARADHASGINEDLPVGGDYRIGGKTVVDTSNTQSLQLGIATGTSSTYSLMAGYRAGQNATGYHNVFLGNVAGANNTGYRNIMIGYWAGNVNAGADNTFIGYLAGRNNAAGTMNVFLGTNAGFSNTTGRFNMMLGGYAGSANTTGERLTFIGFQSGQSNTTGVDNVALGYRAGYKNTTGIYNLNLGTYAGYSDLGGSRNVNIGGQAGFSASGQVYNVNIGDNAGAYNNGSYNVFLGAATDAVPATAVSSIALGYKAKVTGSHQMVVGGDDANGYINAIYLGRGVSSTTPQDVTLQATSGSTGNVNGANLVLKGGAKSGTGTDGVVKVVGELEVDVLDIRGGADLCEMFRIAPASGNADLRALLLESGAAQ